MGMKKFDDEMGFGVWDDGCLHFIDVMPKASGDEKNALAVGLGSNEMRRT